MPLGFNPIDDRFWDPICFDGCPRGRATGTARDRKKIRLMQPTELNLTQQIVTIVAGLFALGLLFGTLMVHAWVLIAWKRIMTWSGWLRD